MYREKNAENSWWNTYLTGKKGNRNSSNGIERKTKIFSFFFLRWVSDTKRKLLFSAIPFAISYYFHRNQNLINSNALFRFSSYMFTHIAHRIDCLSAHQTDVWHFNFLFNLTRPRWLPTRKFLIIFSFNTLENFQSIGTLCVFDILIYFRIGLRICCRFLIGATTRHTNKMFNEKLCLFLFIGSTHFS